jgi:hypothetical protein
VCLRDVRGGALLGRCRVTSHAGGASGAAFLAEGGRLATAAADGRLCVWDAAEVVRGATYMTQILKAPYIYIYIYIIFIVRDTTIICRR